jgi:hypothetical protein
MMPLLEISLFFFVLLGSKVLLGIVVVYMLLPQDPRCDICDDAMLPIAAPRTVAGLLRLVRLERRWCMECRRETLSRRLLSSGRHRHVARPVVEPRFR